MSFARLLCFLPALVALGCSAKSELSGSTAVEASPAIGDDPARVQPTGELVDHPSFKLWSKFPVGTSVTQKTITDSKKSAGHTETTIVYTLKEKDADHLVVEWQATTTYADGRVEKNPPSTTRTPRQIALPPNVKKEDWGKPEKGERGEETLNVLQREFKTKWYKSKGTTDAGPFTSQVWTSDDMPGGLVRSLTEIKAVEEVTTIEITGLTVPK